MRGSQEHRPPGAAYRPPGGTEGSATIEIHATNGPADRTHHREAHDRALRPSSWWSEHPALVVGDKVGVK